MRMMLQWRHLKMLKWAGHANIDNGVVTTQPGDLAICCPSCPRPGVNLPAGWQDVPPEDRYAMRLSARRWLLTPQPDTCIWVLSVWTPTFVSRIT